MDSSTLLYRLASGGREVYPVFVDYGQAQAKLVVKLVTRLIQDCWGRGYKNVHPLHVEPFQFAASMIDGSPLFKKNYRPTKRGSQSIHNAAEKKSLGWIQCRNLMILSVCAAYAGRLKADLYTGHVRNDPDEKGRANEGIPDTSVEFLNALMDVWEYSLDPQVRLVSPFIEEGSGKSAVLQEARARGVPLQYTTSCDYYPPCGKCGACVQARGLGIKQWRGL